MRVRALVVGLALGLLALCLLAPGSAGAQAPATVPRIGLLDAGSLAGRAPLWEAFHQAMCKLGYVEGQNVVFEARGADGKSERLPALAAELVRLKVDAIVTAGSATASAARQATATLPIVMATGGDPIGLGLAASLAQPGGNVTGGTTQTVELSAKRLEMAREVVPGASRLVILGDAGSPLSVSGIRETQFALVVNLNELAT